MSYITSFRIEGLAGRKDPLEIKLNRDINIFFGLNGSGKTSLLKILNSAMSNDADSLYSVPFTAAEVGIFSTKLNNKFTQKIKKPKLSAVIPENRRRIMRSELETADDMFAQLELPINEKFGWSCTPPLPSSVGSWAHVNLPTTRLYIGSDLLLSRMEYTHVKRPYFTEEQFDLAFARSVESLWSSYSAQVLGTVRTAQEQGLASILRAVISGNSTKRTRRTGNLTPTMAYSRVMNFLKRQGSVSMLGDQAAFEKRYSENRTLHRVVQDIDLVEQKIEKAMAERNQLENLVRKMFSGNKEIKFTDDSIQVKTPSGDKIGLASLSSGEKHLLQIFVQTLLAADNSMLIDEPELSMHVDWQRILINCMRILNREAQLIVATHSPEIMADIPDQKIFRI